ncbi:MAG: reverse transcriptase family protein, partial [Candidatus Omnitrophica bacterium]|nr:reverse transcriptase family protein [Candidatus Omnitrophota bacterium]
MPLSMWKSIFPQGDKRILEKTREFCTTLTAANETVIKQYGVVHLPVKGPNLTKTCKFYVVTDSCRPLLGNADMQRLGLISYHCAVTDDWSNKADLTKTTIEEVTTNNKGYTGPITGDAIKAEFKDIFSGIGKLSIDPVKIQLKEDAKPVQRPCRRVHLAMRDRFRQELQSMESQGIIRKVDPNEKTPWLNSFVYVEKKDAKKSLRICLDPSSLNKNIIRPVCNSKTLDEITHLLAGAKYFSVFDATKGFFQLPLDKESQKLTAMLTPEGIYEYQCLAMGMSLSTDVFEAAMRKVLHGLDRVLNIADDIMVYGTSEMEHDQRCRNFLERCRQVDLHLNPDKFKLKLTEVPFFGHLCTAEGLRPDPNKVSVIRNWPRPTNKEELQQFLGTINFLAKYIEQLAHVRRPLQELLRQDSEWLWTD